MRSGIKGTPNVVKFIERKTKKQVNWPQEAKRLGTPLSELTTLMVRIGFIIVGILGIMASLGFLRMKP